VKLLVLILLCASAPLRAEMVPVGFPRDTVAAVLETGFAVLAERYIEPVALSDMSLWGLRGLSALDPALKPELSDGSIRLKKGSRTIAARVIPPTDDPTGWGESTAWIAESAWQLSDGVRRAGPDGVIRAIFAELFSHLDSYSRYASPAEAEAARERRTGTAGVGIRAARRGNRVTISEVIAEGPAAAAGLRRGDRILAVDGKRTAGRTAAQVEAWIEGPEDTRVVLLVASGRGSREVALSRSRVPPETVFVERTEEMLILRVTGFSRYTDRRLAHVLEEVLRGRNPPRGVVLDLRGNRGGLLRQAVVAADLFLSDGVIARTEGRHPASNREWRAEGPDLLGGMPLVILVDGASASSAEVLAASLADRGRAVIVGSATLGKGLVQSIAPLPNDGELLVSWSRVIAPAGWPIQGLGILPQVCTSRGPDDLAGQLAALAHGDSRTAAAVARHRAARAPLPAAVIADLRAPCPSAEPREGDLSAARYLIGNPAAYGAALLADADPRPALPPAAQPPLDSRRRAAMVPRLPE
jgi:carboxyl-terminal processing protease